MDVEDRRASVQRETKETRVIAEVVLDGTGERDIHTGVGFLDHMLEQFAEHGLFDITVQAEGDLGVDEHHTVEDVAIVLGRAFNQALGDRRGIVRMGDSMVPMDEALAQVAVDVGGRGFAVTEVAFDQQWIGDISSSLISHFVQSFAIESRITIHARVLAGSNDHHRAEALFKALGRALDEATRIDVRRMEQVPSTKGTLSS